MKLIWKIKIQERALKYLIYSGLILAYTGGILGFLKSINQPDLKIPHIALSSVILIAAVIYHKWLYKNDVANRI